MEAKSVKKQVTELLEIERVCKESKKKQKKAKKYLTSKKEPKKFFRALIRNVLLKNLEGKCQVLLPIKLKS